MSSLIVLLACSFYSCKKTDEIEHYMMYKNDINDTIVVFSSFARDTTFKISSYAYGCAEIFPNSTGMSPYPVALVDNVTFYVIKNSLQNYWLSTNIEKEQFDVLVRYELSKEDIMSINYTIPYPPTSAMKNMRMCPSYEEITKQQ